MIEIMASDKEKFVSDLTEVVKKFGLDPNDASFTATLAKQFGVTTQSVRDQFNPEKSFPKIERLNQIANAYSTTLDFLMNGNNNVSNGAEIKSKTPVLGSVTAGNFKNVRELEEWEVEEYEDSTKPQNGYRFFMRIDGHSMENPNSPIQLRDGDLVLFNAENKSPSNGAIVLAKLNGYDEITCKRLVKDAWKCYLEPINPRYPILTDPFRVLATAEQIYKPLPY